VLCRGCLYDDYMERLLRLERRALRGRGAGLGHLRPFSLQHLSVSLGRVGVETSYTYDYLFSDTFAASPGGLSFLLSTSE
jgi:hypothetical protein